MSLDEGVLRWVIDGRALGKGPSSLGPNDTPGVAPQFTLDLGGKRGGGLFTGLGWMLEAASLDTAGRSRSTAEALLVGAPERANDPRAMRDLARAHSGAVGKARPFEPVICYEHRMRPPRRLTTRKLLVASLGVAAISYLGCNPREEPPVSGNLMPPQPPVDAGASPEVTIPTEGSAQPPSQPAVVATSQPAVVATSQPSAVTTSKPRPSGSVVVPTFPKTSPVVGNLVAPRLPDAPKK